MTAPSRPRYRSSTCRVSKGPRSHPCSPHHEDLVLGYRLWHETEHQQAETETIGYATELAEYWETHTKPTFRTYLCEMQQRH